MGDKQTTGRAYIGAPVCSLHPGSPWGRCACATPRRPTKREVGEAIGILKDEIARLRLWVEKNAASEHEFFIKLVSQRSRKADRLAKALSWIEALHG